MRRFLDERTLLREILKKAYQMHVKSVVSAIALSTAMLLSGAAIGQDAAAPAPDATMPAADAMMPAAAMINGIEIPADQLAAVQERCDQLKLASDTDPVIDIAKVNADDNAAPESAGEAAPSTENVEEVNEAANAVTSAIDLDTLTIEACVEAGLVEM
jgi:hypothetical protein